MVLTVMPNLAFSWASEMVNRMPAFEAAWWLAVLAFWPLIELIWMMRPPLLLAHAVDDRARHVVAGVEAGVDHFLPLQRGHLVEGGVAGDAGVVDQDVHRPERSAILRHHMAADEAVSPTSPATRVTSMPSALSRAAQACACAASR